MLNIKSVGGKSTDQKLFCNSIKAYNANCQEYIKNFLSFFALFLYWSHLAISTMVSNLAIGFKNGTFYHCKIKLYKILFLFLDSKILILFWDKC